MKKNMLSKIAFLVVAFGAIQTYSSDHDGALAAIAKATTKAAAVAGFKLGKSFPDVKTAYRARLALINSGQLESAPVQDAQPVVVPATSGNDGGETAAAKTARETQEAAAAAQKAADDAAAQKAIDDAAAADKAAADANADDDAKLEAVAFGLFDLVEGAKHPGAYQACMQLAQHEANPSSAMPQPSAEAAQVLADNGLTSGSSYKLKALGRLGRKRMTAAEKARHKHLVKEKGGKHNKKMQKRKKADAKRKAAAKKAKKRGSKKHRGGKRKAAPKRGNKKRRGGKRVRGQVIANNNGRNASNNGSNKRNNPAVKPASKNNNNGNNNGSNGSSNGSNSGDATASRFKRNS